MGEGARCDGVGHFGGSGEEADGGWGDQVGGRETGDWGFGYGVDGFGERRR